MSVPELPNGLIGFGPDANCTLDLCPIEASVFQYRPSLPANVIFTALFGVIGLVHIYLGFRWKSWGFMTGMVLGCLTEIIGYIGRVLQYDNPFDFSYFMMQIVCLTIAPVFYTASIYVTLSQTIVFLGPELSRFKPQLFYWIFIPFDLVCLVLQAVGGAMSTEAGDGNDVGVDISMAGLILQVIVLFAFVIAFGDYLIRYSMARGFKGFGWRINVFFSGLAVSTIFILGRCAFRVAELREGYDGELITHEVPFIVLEGVFIVVAVLALFFSHPGMVFNREAPRKSSSDTEESGIAGFERERK
jgi:hypothetical protein